MKVSIFYLKEDLRYDNDEEQNIIERMSYERGYREFSEEPLSIETHYVEVKSSEIDDEGYPDVYELMNELFHIYNFSGARVITQMVRNGELEGIDHSSMSVGDIIKINEEIYIVEGIGFRKIN
jgi:hypothetical protein